MKRDLIRYFGLIAPAMLPHLEDRPLNLQRFPDGAMAPGFWQKDLRPTDPTWLRRWREAGVESRGANTHLVADRTATLCWLGNQAAFEVHAWTSRLTAPDRPTFALIDIDPGERTSWAETLILARLFRTALGHLGVRGYPKLTGKRGIQVWVPVEPRYGYDETSAWVEGVSRAVGATVPELVSWEWAKERRDGRARLDYTQNTYIKTLVAPYAVRPAPGAPVSAPITWDELDDPNLTAQRWTDPVDARPGGRGRRPVRPGPDGSPGAAEALNFSLERGGRGRSVVGCLLLDRVGGLDRVGRAGLEDRADPGDDPRARLAGGPGAGAPPAG